MREGFAVCMAIMVVLVGLLGTVLEARAEPISTAVGLALSVVCVGFSVVDAVAGTYSPSAEITSLDISTHELVVGDVVEVCGTAAVDLGHVVDCGLFTCDYNDALVTVTCKVDSTGAETSTTRSFSNLAKARALLDRARPNESWVSGDPATWKKTIDFSFCVEGSDDLRNGGNDSVTVTVSVRGAVGGTWGQDEFETVEDHKTVPFVVKKAYEVTLETGDPEPIHGRERFYVTMRVRNLSRHAHLTVLVGQVDLAVTRNLRIPPGAEKVVARWCEPHTADHEGPNTVVMDAIEVAPIKVQVQVDLRYSQNDHVHTLERLQDQRANCRCVQSFCRAERMPDPPEQPPDPAVQGCVSRAGDYFDGIEGAEVTATNVACGGEEQFLTDEYGEFHFCADAGTLWELHASAEGFYDKTTLLSVPSVNLVEVKLDLQPMARAVFGSIADEQGNAVLTDVLFSTASGEEYMTFSNPLGHFVLSGLPLATEGEVVVGNSEGMFGEPLAVSLDATSGMTDLGDLRIARPDVVRCEGIVVDATGMWPVHGAVVSLLDSAGELVLARTLTGSLGDFELTYRDPTPRETLLRVVHECLGTLTLKLFTPAALTRFGEVRMPNEGTWEFDDSWVAIAESDTSPTPHKIMFWIDSCTDEELRSLEELAARFLALTGIDVLVSRMPETGTANLLDGTAARSAVSDLNVTLPPSVALVSLEDAITLADAGCVDFDATEAAWASLESRTDELAFFPGIRDAVKSLGSPIAVPIDAWLMVNAYRSDIVDPEVVWWAERIPRRLDELMELAEPIAADMQCVFGDGCSGFFVPDGTDDSYLQTLVEILAMGVGIEPIGSLIVNPADPIAKAHLASLLEFVAFYGRGSGVEIGNYSEALASLKEEALGALLLSTTELLGVLGAPCTRAYATEADHCVSYTLADTLELVCPLQGAIGNTQWGGLRCLAFLTGAENAEHTAKWVEFLLTDGYSEWLRAFQGNRLPTRPQAFDTWSSLMVHVPNGDGTSLAIDELVPETIRDELIRGLWCFSRPIYSEGLGAAMVRLTNSGLLADTVTDYLNGQLLSSEEAVEIISQGLLALLDADGP